MAPKPHGVYVDATFGGGTHTRLLLEAEPTCSVIAFDWDIRAIEQNSPALIEAFPGRLTCVWANFANMQQQLKKRGITKVDGIVADLGTSQFQLKQGLGFSSDPETPLDMRMSPAHQQTTAAHIVNRATEAELSEILWMYGDERNARRIAQAIIRHRPITTIGQLADVVSKTVHAEEGPRQTSIHHATRTFQALRIVVNQEFENIRSLIAVAPGLIAPGGRFVCMTFHSTEDRLVKLLLAQQANTWKPLTKHVITPSPEELAENPSARSVKLRAVERLS